MGRRLPMTYRLRGSCHPGTRRTSLATSPSEDPRLMQFCPNRACMTIIEQANTYVHRKLVGRLASDYGPLFGSVDYLAIRERLIDALAAGDLDATKAVSRGWCRRGVRWTPGPEEVR